MSDCASLTAIDNAADFLRGRLPSIPKVAVTIGSGLGGFVERRMLLDGVASDAIRDVSYFGLTLGARMRPWERIVLEAGYRQPVAAFADETDEPDGWGRFRVSWIL